MALAGDPLPRRLALLAGIIYACFYLFAIGDVDLVGSSQWRAQLGQIDFGHLLRARSPFLFEAVALLQAGNVLLLISPLNLLITGALAALLGANVHGALALHQNPACRTGNGRMFGGALPALLAGSACCAPSIVLLLGIPGLAAFSGFFAYLIPMSVVILGLNRWWQRRQGAPALIRFR